MLETQSLLLAIGAHSNWEDNDILGSFSIYNQHRYRAGLPYPVDRSRKVNVFSHRILTLSTFYYAVIIDNLARSHQVSDDDERTKEKYLERRCYNFPAPPVQTVYLRERERAHAEK